MHNSNEIARNQQDRMTRKKINSKTYISCNQQNKPSYIVKNQFETLNNINYCMIQMQFKVKAKLMYKRVKEKSKLVTKTRHATKGQNNSIYKKNPN